MRIKKVVFASVMAFFGLFWVSCSDDDDMWVEKVEKTESRLYTSPGTHTFTFDRPAEIEIYALGAGGGGQGGHNKTYLFGSDVGTGGAGGGGAAVYARFSVDGPVAFDITVGSGGTGGTRVDIGVGPDLQSGNPGGAGGETRVRWAAQNITLTAEGGRGGGGSGAVVTGGIGGRARPTDLPTSNRHYIDGATAAGQNGTNGSIGNDVRSEGGRAAVINRGAAAPFAGGNGALRPAGGSSSGIQSGGGGSGGYNAQSGSAGSSGQVYIIWRYYTDE